MDPLLRAIEASGVVLGVHTFPSPLAMGIDPIDNARSPGDYVERSGRGTGRTVVSSTFSFILEATVWLSQVLLSGLLDRYPRLKMAIFESNASWLPELLDQLGIQRPILLGHSDGGSIALIHAGGSGRPVRGLVLMAPHLMVEDLSVRSIQAAKQAYETTNLREKLARYHSHPDATFWGWNDIWLHPDFRAWNIEEYLPRVHCPILAIQGEDDEYGTMEQVERIARAVPRTQVLKLKNCGHSPHRDQPDAVIERGARFIAEELRH
jgi:pimeloyl-ACP methyl ester carboxylesterase